MPVTRTQPIIVGDYFARARAKPAEALFEIVGLAPNGQWELLNARGPLDGHRQPVWSATLANGALWRRVRRPPPHAATTLPHSTPKREPKMTTTKAAVAALTNTEVLQVALDAKGAAVVDTQIVGAAPFAGTVTAAEIVLNAAVTGDTTNTRTFTLTNKGQAGVGTTSMATLALITANDVVAFDAKPMVLSVVANALNVAAGDILSLAQTVGGTGLAHSGGVIRVTITRT